MTDVEDRHATPPPHPSTYSNFPVLCLWFTSLVTSAADDVERVNDLLYRSSTVDLTKYVLCERFCRWQERRRQKKPSGGRASRYVDIGGSSNLASGISSIHLPLFARSSRGSPDPNAIYSLTFCHSRRACGPPKNLDRILVRILSIKCDKSERSIVDCLLCTELRKDSHPIMRAEISAKLFIPSLLSTVAPSTYIHT